jgi:Spy/CpxP family protein refolding chaperone
MSTLRALLFIFLAAAMLWSPHPARAQHGTMMQSFFGSQFQPEFSARDLKVMIRVLNLTPEGEQALQALYEGYADTLRIEGDAVKEKVEAEIERAEILNDTRLLSSARAHIGEFGKRAAQLRAQFLDDLKSLLTREQEANWPILERELRRLKTIGKGQLTAENVDVVRLTEDIIGDSAMPVAVAELLGRYREELDRALQARERFMDEEGKQFHTLAKEDVERALKLFEEARERRRAVRDINERFARLVATELSDEQRALFEKKLFELSFPMLCRESRVDVYLKNALELDSLSREQQQDLESIKGRHERQRLAWVRSTAAAWRDLEEGFKPPELAKALGEGPEDPYNRTYNGAWLGEEHPLNQARVQRLEFERATRESINRVLTPEQRKGIPNTQTGTAKFENWMSWGL